MVVQMAILVLLLTFVAVHGSFDHPSMSTVSVEGVTSYKSYLVHMSLPRSGQAPGTHSHERIGIATRK